MKKTLLCFLVAFLSLPLFAQDIFAPGNIAIPVSDVTKVSRPGKGAAYRSGMALIVLGPTKIAVGSILGGFAVANAVNNNERGGSLAVLVYGVVGGFHLITGIAITASGAVLLNKAKRQNKAQHSRALGHHVHRLALN